MFEHGADFSELDLEGNLLTRASVEGNSTSDVVSLTVDTTPGEVQNGADCNENGSVLKSSFQHAPQNAKKENTTESCKENNNCMKSETAEQMFSRLKMGLKDGKIAGKELVDSVFQLLVGGPFNMENAFLIQNKEYIIPMVYLLDAICIFSAEMWCVFIGIARKSHRNLEACAESGLIRALLGRLPDAEDVVADFLIELLTILTTYSINVKDMKMLLRALRAVDDKWPRHSAKLLLVIKQMLRKEGPDVFFSFFGGSKTGIHIPPLSKWPYQNGWSFVTWVRLDPESSATFEEETPYLFSFRTRNGLGHSCHFVGNCMVVTTVKNKNGQSVQQCIKYELQVRKWYHVVLAYSYSRWGRSELQCFVNGQPVSGFEFNWHVSTNEYDRCFVGCCPDSNGKNSFSGQMSVLYLFSESLNLQQVNSLYGLGPNYQSCFKFKNEVDIPIAYMKYLFDGKLSSALVFAYSPQNCDRQLCLNSVMKENQGYFFQTPHAVMMDGVNVVVTHSIHTTLHSVGGVQVFLPLLTQLDFPVQTSCDHSTLLSIFSQLMVCSPGVQQQLLQTNAFLVIGVSLTAADKKHITESVLNTFIEMAHFLISPESSSANLLRQLFEFVLLNPNLWINTDGRVSLVCLWVQTRLYQYLATDFYDKAKIFNPVRRVTTIMQLLHSLKFYYWVTDPRRRSGIDGKGKAGPRPTVDNILTIRAHILTLMYKIVSNNEPGAQTGDELKAILNFLTTVHEDDNLTDVLSMLIKLVAANPAMLIPAFDKKRGVWVVFKLIGAANETVRLLALKLFGFFLCRCTSKRKQDTMNPYNLYTLLTDRLLLHATYINVRTYNVLFEILIEKMTSDILDGRHPEPSTNCKFENPMLIRTIASLLQQSDQQNTEVLEVKKVFLTDLIHMCTNSSENRRIILQMSVWQDWLISLTSLEPNTEAEMHIRSLVYHLFAILLHHAIKLEYGGWRVWIDTMAIIHSKGSFERFCRKNSGKAVSRLDMTQSEKNDDVEKEVVTVVQDLLSKVAGQSSTVASDESQSVFSTSNVSSESTYVGSRSEEKASQQADSTVPLYRIPEFRWSAAHLTLLSDLLLGIESDIAVWKNDGSRSLIDYINQSDNAVFVVNAIHVMSQSLDSFIVACGGLLPLLAALTSPSSDLEIADTSNQGLSMNVAISFLVRLANLADVIVFGTACNFADLEREKNMPTGGILRQILRLVTMVAVRNCLVYRYKSCFDHQLVVCAKERAIKALVDDLTSLDETNSDFLNLKTTVQDPERVLQEVDVYRLKATLYRDIEESRQAQFLALATIYFLSVLMVSRYRDILEPPSSPSPFHNTVSAGSNFNQTAEYRKDNSKIVPSEAKTSVKNENDEQSLLSGAKSAADGFHDLTDSIRLKQDENVSNSPMATVETAPPKSDQSSSKDDASKERQALLSARLRTALEPVAPLFREIIADFQSYFQKTLLGTHGQEIMNDPKGIGVRFVLNTLRNSNVSVIELVMLLCSQEWQTSVQKHAGLAFIELVNEGRLLAHATRDHLVRVANEAEYILNRMRAEDVMKHAEFEAMCAQLVVTSKEEESTCNLLISAARRRNTMISRKILDKVHVILRSEYGAWGVENRAKMFWKLDIWEDDSRRRRRLVPNSFGSSHPEATLKSADNQGEDESEVEKTRDAFASYLRDKNIVLPSSTPSSLTNELLTETEIVLWNEETDEEVNQQAGSCFITPCHLVAPGLVLPGILSITANELSFDCKDDDAELQQADPAILRYCEHLHGRWHTAEIRAIFLRRHLLQNRALEIFLTSRTAIMFAFPDQNTVKKVVQRLPAVGVGQKYGIAQSRKASLMTPRQLFKHSDMPQKWQRREICNFEYLMFLNTIAGRTYNDLNQYPVFPWILSNYDSEELDLKQPANFRDLSKPVGALNDSRRKYFIDRYRQWEHDKIPPFHYGTHYSTAAFTMNWLMRMEPFTSLFLSLQSGKFDHADRMFHSVAESWKHCLRDTHDVKELIPEFFYLPEMFLNINGYQLGKRDDGSLVGDVILPPWAKSPEHFITIHRQALESDLVSCQLHQWIDLIFGYKQRGPEAVRATNVFYYLTYEGVVDLSSFDDPMIKKALENQIRNFGQTPAQLLSEPHTPRQSIMTISPLMFQPVPDDICMIMKFISNSAVVHLSANTHAQLPNPTVVSITASLGFALNRWNNNYSGNFGSHLAPVGVETAGSTQNLVPPNLPLTVDPLLATGNPASPVARRMLGDSLDQHLTIKWNNFVTTCDSKYIFVCGYPDHSFRVIETENARIRQVIFGHKSVVTCLARSEASTGIDFYIASGSSDCTVLLWQWNVKSSFVVGEQNITGESASPRVILIGHDSEITCIHVSAEHGLVLSTSVGGPLLIHTTQGDLLRCLRPAEQDQQQHSVGSPRILLMSRECYAVVCYDLGNLCLFTTNGRLISQLKTASHITCMCLSRDGEYFVTGSEEGTVSVYATVDLKCLYAYSACDGAAVRSVAIVYNHRHIVAGLSNGAIVVYNVDFNKWHHEYRHRYVLLSNSRDQ
ncbi:putative neurobeachin -like protein [Trichinella murrelli]|uniref:Putative neurobeachin homolog n=1 Tax=Trichinella murrelli TaxID=144512 RepID=A0A0V0TC87_9BILA|nr:putative neurobeachin -like protein [Trichinella murrelli]